MKPRRDNGTNALFRFGNVRCLNESQPEMPSISAASYMSFGSACNAPLMDIIMKGTPSQILTKITIIWAPVGSAKKSILVPRRSFTKPSGRNIPFQINTEIYDGTAQGKSSIVRYAVFLLFDYSGVILLKIIR